MNPREIFQQYRAERRAHECIGFKRQLFPHLSRYVADTAGSDGFVAFADFNAESAAAIIGEHVAFFEQLGQSFEWKVYDFDSPGNLREILGGLGFEQSDVEAFLVVDPKNWVASTRDIPGLSIKRVTSPHQLREFVAAEQSIWPQHDQTRHMQQYAEELARNPNSISIYCAYLNDEPVGTGRVRFPSNSAFAELNGGGVVASVRGRGIFSALLNQRLADAVERGFRWVAVDAAPMSRPILLQKGFRQVCWTYPMIHRARARA